MEKPSKKEFENLVNSQEGLCDAGFITYPYIRRTKIDPVQDKKNLLASYKEFLLCCEWLSGCQLTKNATDFSPSSYKLKHKVERHYGTYISNGTLIAAALYLKIPVKNYFNSISVGVAISKRSPLYKEPEKFK